MTMVYFLIISWHCIIEALRVYAGYQGNIEEAFPEMITFICYCITDMLILGILTVPAFPLEEWCIIISIIFNFIELCYA
jgi:hypothetical protein